MKKRIISGMLVFFMLFLFVGVAYNTKPVNSTFNINDNDIPLSSGDTQSLSGLEFASQLGAGWNLGNSFCCADNNAYGVKSVTAYETLWGNPATTRTTIDALKAEGFKTIRIPITYRNHIDENNQIDPKWLSRIKEVVDYVLDDNMYCIINVHHEDWLIADESKQEEGRAKLDLIWRQVSNYFSGYGNSLIFEGFNEVINSAGQWDSADAKSYAVVNSYNQTFVNAVRESGGKNSSRYLIVNTYAAKATTSVLSGFILPSDSIEDHLIVGTHIYDGVESTKTKLNNLNNLFIKKGIPVIIGEWGRINSASNTEASRITYAKGILSSASSIGIPCVWWDDGGIFKTSSAVTNYAILQRKTGEWYFKNLADTIVANSVIKCPDSSKITKKSDVFGIKDISSWKSGDYNYSTGKYISNNSRICVQEDKLVESKATYHAVISDVNYHLLVRVMSPEGKLVKSYNLSNGGILTVDSDEYIIRISLYNYASSAACKSFDDYKKLYENGFYAYFDGYGVSVEPSETESVPEIIEQDKPEVEEEIKTDAAETDKVNENQNETVNEQITDDDDEMIIEEISSIDAFGMKNWQNWQSGNYSSNTGKYTASAGRICLKEYNEVSEGKSYTANISDSKYRILVRSLSSDYKLLSSQTLSDKGKLVIGEGVKYIGISLYDTKSTTKTFDAYKDLFENGFESYLVSDEVEEIVSTDKEAPVVEEDLVLATPKPILGVPNNQEAEVVMEGVDLSDTSETALRKEIIAMFETGDITEHDISRFKLTTTQLNKIFYSIEDNECLLPYECNASLYYSTTTSNGYVKTFKLTNVDKDFKERYNRAKATIEDIKSGMDSKMTDLDKIVYVYNYFDGRIKYSSASTFMFRGGSVLADFKGCCNGISTAYRIVMTELGIESCYVSSSSMSHGWVLVKLDGEWYHLDLTWDNTRTESISAASRTYLIRNDSEYKSSVCPKKHYNWSTSGNYTSTSAKYTNWFVHDVTGTMEYQDGYWYYTDNKTGHKMKAKIDGSEIVDLG